MLSAHKQVYTAHCKQHISNVIDSRFRVLRNCFFFIIFCCIYKCKICKMYVHIIRWITLCSVILFLQEAYNGIRAHRMYQRFKLKTLMCLQATTDFVKWNLKNKKHTTVFICFSPFSFSMSKLLRVKLHEYEERQVQFEIVQSFVSISWLIVLKTFLQTVCESVPACDVGTHAYVCECTYIFCWLYHPHSFHCFGVSPVTPIDFLKVM